METTMRYGARKGTMNFWRRWLAKAASRELSIFPVPGADLLRIYQSEPLHGEARLADSPKEANVLLVIGDVSTELAERAATVYAQMPRPRVLVIAGPEHLDPLPHPDVHVPLEKDFLETALSAARECLSSYSWTEEAEPYRPEKLAKEIEAAAQQQGHMHHHHHGHGGHGHDHGDGGHGHSHEGHDHSGHDHSGHGGHGHDHGHGGHGHSHEGHDHSAHDHSGHGGHGHDHSQHGGHSHEGHDHSGHDHEGHDHSGHDHSGHGGHDHGHGGHDHGPGFMSMIAMTKDLPRSPDGLPMEWSDVQFGPFHPGLPGGLSLSMKLDGDTVVKAEAGQGLLGHNLPASVLNNPASLPEYLAAAHPMAPVTYRLLAQKALVNFSGKTPDSTLTLSEAVMLEKERVTSHLNWMAVFATALGSDWMRDQAIKHYHRFQNGIGNMEQLSGFIRRIKKMPYLKLKLSAAVHNPGGTEKHSEEAAGTHKDHHHEHNADSHSGHCHEESGEQKPHDHGGHEGHEHDHGAHGHGEEHDHHEGHGHSHEGHQHGEHDHHSHEMHQHTGHETHDHHEHVHHDHASKDEKNKVTGAVPGQLPDDITGPVARAAGIEKDHRLEEAVYQQAGWTPVTAAGNNAWSRLMVRLDEMEQSLRFIEKAGNDSGKESSRKINIPSVGMGNGIAHIESPRGIVTLKFHIHEGKLAHMHLTTPSVALAGLVKPVTEQQELADALIAVNSLDISPWEINP